jgi:hypothetical protein
MIELEFTDTAPLGWDEHIEFTDTAPNCVSRSFIRLLNRGERSRELQVIQLMEPFYCLLNKTVIDSKYSIKLPLEFRPRIKQDYVDKILIRVEGFENPLTYIIKGRCI